VGYMAMHPLFYCVENKGQILKEKKALPAGKLEIKFIIAKFALLAHNVL
jgi:hypothetical protein